MDNILFINACVRPNSRTMDLAQTLLQTLKGNIQEVRLQDLTMPALDLDGIAKREWAARNNDFSDPVFDLAKQFAVADVIVIAAPYWDLMFPAALKTYFENVIVSDITFRYSPQGRPEGLCKAKMLHYVTTSGGFIGENDFGFSYVQALAQNFFEIPEVKRYAAQGLDIFGADGEKILGDVKIAILEAAQR